ncbi:MAG TPA: toxin TcdB middle/N-terminal domain-containing protein, partial [Longimicrobium sp.]|nr:toxin TcdB middle/N-terminal domain-containing protein [Longimicrobium sp.]
PTHPLGTGGVELVDLFGRGLPDLLEMNGRVRYWRNLGGGRFDRARTMSDAPAGVALHGPGVQLLDADGDGRAELLVTRGAQAGWFALGEDGGWDRRSFRPYAVAPSFSLDDPEVRLVDLDGDGVTDALRAGARLECWFSVPDQGWGEAASVDRSVLEGLEGLSFTDPRVRMADMSGDGLQDVVVVRGRSVEYWPSLGRGRWGRPVRMADAPVLPWNYDPRRLLLGDVDGDGAADLVYVEDGCVTLWLNRVGEGWSAPVVIRGTPRVADTDTVRLADVFGNGIAGVLWSGGGRTAGRAGLRFLDFTGGAKPYLLTGLDAHLGSVTRVEYAPSTRFRLADEAVPALRWRTPLPFPVHVVSRSWAIDQISGRWLTTEYSYHHGYWDGEEREFRGFGRVDWRDAEALGDGGPGGEKPAGGSARRAVPLETRTWFHPGAVRDGSGGWRGAEYSHEHWPEPGMRPFPSPVLPESTAADARARRDALCTLRGRVLREEVYALDGSPLSARPFTVVERAWAVREEDADTAAGRRRIFFPHEVAARTTQWDRGDEPMTSFSFTGDYDGYGQPRLSLSVAVPRGRDPYAAGDHPEPYLCTVRRTVYARPPEGRWMMDRVACVTGHEVADVRGGSVEALRAAVMDGAEGGAPLTLRVIGQTLSFYDGAAFEGLPLGRVGATGALVRAEDLVLTAGLLREAYGDAPPPWFAGDGVDWSGYPAEV